MKVQEKSYLMASSRSINCIMNSLDLREDLEVIRIEITIQVLPDDAGPMVPEIDAIRVNHWQNEEIEVLNDII